MSGPKRRTELQRQLLKAVNAGSVFDCSRSLAAAVQIAPDSPREHYDRDCVEFVQLCVDNDGGNPLHRAAAAGAAALLKYFLDLGCDVDSRKRDAKTPLHEACNHGCVECVSLLLARGADPNAHKTNAWTPLHCAGQNSSVGTIRSLLAAGALVDERNREGATPLFLAAREGHAEAVAELISAGADVNAATRTARTPLLTAVEHGRCSVVSALLEAGADATAVDSCGQTVWHACAAPGDVEMAHLLLNSGIPFVESGEICRGQHPLHQAAAAGRAAFVDFLLGGGPENAEDSELSAAKVGFFRRNPVDPNRLDADGCTALYYACCGGRADVVKLLLARKADPNRFCSARRSPLHACAGIPAVSDSSVCRLYVACAQMLLEAGARPDALDKDGATPLHAACATGAPLEMLDALLSADWRIALSAGSRGRTPFEDACAKGHATAALRLFQEAQRHLGDSNSNKNTIVAQLWRCDEGALAKARQSLEKLRSAIAWEAAGGSCGAGSRRRANDAAAAAELLQALEDADGDLLQASEHVVVSSKS